jgi:hypothetical protein
VADVRVASNKEATTVVDGTLVDAIVASIGAEDRYSEATEAEDGDSNNGEAVVDE